ncbi:MFS transporter [Amycolatopsis sacchari]|uniref:MFS transporter n=1 Tax=Amycolatopsis sacchari TaxID=115433 RepID=UPI003D756A42
MTEARQRQQTGPGLALVLCSFALNGALYGSLLSRYAEIANRVHAGEAAFGAVLAIAAAGGLLGSIVAPVLVRAVRDVAAVTLFGCAFAVLAVGVAAAPALGVLTVAFFLMTLVDGGQDVSMNALAVRVQQLRGQSVLGRAHAVWSLSLSTGTALGALAAALGVPVALHISVSAAAAAAMQTGAWWRMRGRIAPSGRTAAAGAAEPPAGPRRPAHRQARLLLAVLGVAAIAASYVESPGQEWTAVLLDRGFAAGPGLAAAGPLVFSVGLLVSRLLLDPLTQRLPRAAIARAAGTTIAACMITGLLIPASAAGPWPALAMIGLAGVGAGPVFPLLFGAAEILSERHRVAPATTTSIISALSRTGAISAPAVVGAVTSTTSLHMVFAVIAAGGLVVTAALPRALRPARTTEP